MKKRWFCLFLALVLCLGAVPADVLAAHSMGAPLILTHSKAKYYAIAAQYTAEHAITSGLVLGGEGLTSADAAEAIFAN